MPRGFRSTTNRLLNELLETAINSTRQYEPIPETELEEINTSNEGTVTTHIDEPSPELELDDSGNPVWDDDASYVGNGRRYPRYSNSYFIPSLQPRIKNHSINVSDNLRTFLQSIYTNDNVYITRCKSIKILADFLLNERNDDKFKLLNEKIFKGVKSISELPDGYINFNGKQKMKLGRILNGIWKTIIGSSSYDESYYIERVINDYKSWNYNKNDFDFKYLEGNDILDGYNRNKQIYNSSNMGNSCMNDKHYILGLYTQNEDKLSLLVLMDKSGKIHGRALVWELDNPSLTYMDRIYVSKDSIENIFVKYARDHNMIYRTSGYDEYFQVFIPKGDGKYEKKCNTKYKMSVKLKTRGLKYFPFMDSLNIKTKNGILTNKLGFNIIVWYNTLQHTGGGMGRLRCRVFGKLRS